jgi:signal transduction histidine kinase/ligand-binding sensor domain-containing protein
MKAYHRHFLVFLSLVIQLAALAQEITFNKILPPDGRPFEHVTGMVQDSQGFMWLATKRGLFRYDGYQMTSYKNNPLDINSLATNALEVITVDLNGIIWIGTQGFGLDRYDPFTGIFTHFRHHDNDPSSLSSDYVGALLVDRDGMLWIGSSEGLSRYEASTGRFKHYPHRPNDSTSISSNEVMGIYEDSKGTLWIGTGSVYGADKDKMDKGGLNRFDKTTGTFTRYMHDPNDEHSLINNKVRAIFEDSKGNFWVGTAGDGLHTMDRTKGTFRRHRYDPAFPEKLSRPPLHKLFAQFDHITFIKEDASGSIWIGTTESGLNNYNPKTGRVTHYQSRKDTTGAFIDRTTWASYISRDGIVWISTLEGSLYTVNPVKRNIPFYKSINGSINAFYEEEDGTFWIGTHNGGLIQNNPQNGTVKKFVHDPKNPETISNNTVHVISKDKQGKIWVGTGGGLQLFNKEKGTFVRYGFDAKNKNSLSSDYVVEIYEDRESNLWIGTFRGLNRMNPATGLVTRYIFYPEDTSFLGSNTITSIWEDHQGQIWVSCALGGGVQRLNPANGNFKNYLKGDGMIKILEDAGGTMWVAGNDLYQYNQRYDTFYRFVDPVSVIELNNIRSFMKDDNGNFWIGKSDGILKIDRSHNESILYTTNYGVNGNELAFGSCYKGPNGKLYFGHSNGYYAFLPGDLLKDSKPPQIIISDFRLANRLVVPGKNGPLPQPLAEVKKIRLHYNQNVFSFDFASIDYADPVGNRHLFILENYDNEWRQSGAEHRAHYFNVPPGQYTFRVKGSNSYGIWAEKSIDIIILPPWWLTWWAYCIYGLLFVALVFATYRFQKQRIILAERKRTQERERVHAKEIEKAYTELKATQAQLIQSEKMASLGELTAGIAHEIQNPLNFVNNFSEVNGELIQELQAEAEKGNLDDVKGIAKEIGLNSEKINHHGKRAAAIVKGMLQHSRASSGQKEPTDINALADEYLRLAYHGLRAKDKSFNAAMKTDFDPGIRKINIVPQDIGRVILNLINNAFYAVVEKKKQIGDGYDPTVSVSTKKTNDKVEIKVSDNGKGIPQKVLDKIFQPFFTTKPTGQGTGLGLSLSYDIVKAHGGELKVETKENEGTEFIIKLPIISK